ncbi:hypothetical protein [Janthinobacterium sp. MDT1-19]|uniref:hypothetical protein n=1 Tax=Janthinobacterium sp. MDT1-19 TaxID=1259339 RepID=UPI003F2361E8
MSATRLSIHAERAADILAAVKRFGAATIHDLSAELKLHHETIRKSLISLVETGEVAIIEQATTNSRALYGMPDLDDQAEFDLYRTRSSNWTRGQHSRDCMVAALFGASAAEVRP